ncbi:response regulator [Paenibacillus sp. PAMC21692]|uniref:response regulator n=1 Tax=Paenibacillus sp. PAMC21692 TaxID=2762320 RepID=UPI00164DF6B4|nr:response regulator [Paenibacillus sp. PAMC21692]QNK56680.1 response regulator [Paenibacillus sp. PAMC21692]
MYKLLIVDDEKEIRNGLAERPWHSLGIELVGLCRHGMEALQFVARQPVDIVLTDIRMPFMSGLELMEAIHRQFPFTQMLILSGYSDFDYARQAILNGAADYLLKPVNPDDLAESFRKLTARLDEKKQIEYRTAVLKRKEKLLAKKLREEFLQRLLRSPIPEDELEQASSEGEVLLGEGGFAVAVGMLDRFAEPEASVPERERKLILFALDNLLGDIWDAHGSGYHWIDQAAGMFYLLSVRGAGTEAFVSVIRQLDRFMGLFKSTISLGVGFPARVPGAIPASATAALQSLASCPEPGAVVVFDELHRHRPVPSGETALAEPETAANDGTDKAEGRSYVLAQAKQYMEANYHRSLTLHDVAAHVYVSPGHLSSLFKETGDTFLKHLTSLRMQRAMELLPDVGKKVYEIVEMVGYSDPAYFAAVFKKHTGKTPFEYRSSLSVDGRD